MPALLTDQGDAPAAADLYATALLDGPLPIHPPALNERSDLVDQAYSEFRNLRAAGVEVDPDAFCARFPAYETSLRKLVEVHREIEADPSLLKKLDRWPVPGDEFLGFQLGQELGRGAFARVFLAREPAVGNRQVVVKVSLHADDEVDTLGKFRHPNVVPILYAPRSDKATGFSVVCMPYLGSTTLLPVMEKLAAQKKLPDRGDFLLRAAKDERWPADSTHSPARAMRRGSYQDAVLYLGERLASALAYVHERGILHRDLKPSNVLLCPNGEPVLIDFNLAYDKSIAEYRLGGTLPYMPPEQLESLGRHRGEAIPADNRADLYALGVLLYELLAGAHPFGPVPLKLRTSEARQFLLERQKKRPRSMRSRNRSIDPALEAIILRCLSYDPAARPATARELAKELRRLQNPIRQARRWAAAHVKMLAIMGAFLLTGTAGAAGYVASLPSHAQKAEKLYRDGKYETAIEEFNLALEPDDNQPALHYARGRAYQKLGRLDYAIRDFEAADPEHNGNAAARLAYCFELLNDFASSVKYYKMATHANNAAAAVFNNLSFALSRCTRNLEGAESAATDALERTPGLRAAYYNRAFARHALWQKTRQPAYALDGLVDIREAINRGATRANAYFLASTLACDVLTDRYRLAIAKGKELDDLLAKAANDRLYAEGAKLLLLAVQNGYPTGSLNLGSPWMKCRTEWASQLPLDIKVEHGPNGIDLDLRLIDPVND